MEKANSWYAPMVRCTVRNSAFDIRVLIFDHGDSPEESTPGSNFRFPQTGA